MCVPLLQYDKANDKQSGMVIHFASPLNSDRSPPPPHENGLLEWICSAGIFSQTKQNHNPQVSGINLYIKCNMKGRGSKLCRYIVSYPQLEISRQIHLSVCSNPSLFPLLYTRLSVYNHKRCPQSDKFVTKINEGE